MYPYLINIGVLHIQSFAVFLVLAVIAGTFIIWKQAKEKLYTESLVFDTVVLTLIGGYLFARLGYIAQHLDVFGTSLLKWMAFWVFPGMYMFTGLLGGIFILWYQSRRNKEINFWNFIDLFGFAFWISVCIGYFGIFLSGLEQGTTSSINGIVHPVSLYKLLSFIILLIPYLVFRNEYQKEDRFHKREGSVGLLSTALFSAVILIFDQFKVRELIGYLSIDQWIAGIMVIISSVIFYMRHDRSPRKDWISLRKATGGVIKRVSRKPRSDKRRVYT